MTRVLITGAGGFIGQKLCPVLEDAGFAIVPVYRTRKPDPTNRYRDAKVDKSIDATTDWSTELADIDVVVHLAAKVHVMNGDAPGDLASFRSVNVEGTRNLARQAARFGVKRFVYLSSIKVNGERTNERPFVADQAPSPEDFYGTSKMEAEVALTEIAEETAMEVVIIRPPLVYGPGVKGNLATLADTVRKGIPLPLGAVTNRRDFVSIYNLIDLIKTCCLHSAAAGRTFLVSDNQPLSTVELIRYISKGLGRKARLFSVPAWLLKLAAGLSGNAAKVEKLIGNLQIDMSATQETLGWKPPFTVAESFQKMFAED